MRSASPRDLSRRGSYRFFPLITAVRDSGFGCVADSTDCTVARPSAQNSNAMSAGFRWETHSLANRFWEFAVGPNAVNDREGRYTGGLKGAFSHSIGCPGKEMPCFAWYDSRPGTALGRTRCLVPSFDGAFLSHDSKDALWDKFYTAAPPRRRQSVEQYKIVKRA